MIKKIVIRDVASYDHEGCTFEDLKKVNFIYGGNGTGKTTLSRVLGSMNPEVEFPGCEVVWDDGKPKKVLVYNRDFKERNLQESMPGVFMIGEEWINTEKRVEEMQPQLQMAMDDLRVAENEVVEAKAELARDLAAQEEELWNEVYEKYMDFEACLKGQNSKEAFAERLRMEVRSWQVTHEADAFMGKLDVEEMRERYRGLYEEGAEPRNDNPMSGYIIFEREILTRDLWQYMAEDAHELVLGQEKRTEELRQKCDEMEDRLGTAQYACAQVRTTMTDMLDLVSTSKPSMDHINQKLKDAELTGFSIQPSPLKDNYYQIQRADGSYVKDTLSEGETSLITFLYFMEEVRKRSPRMFLDFADVVVIDDPITSMDGELVFDVCEMVSDLIADVREQKRGKVKREKETSVKQVIVLTHNKAFHKAVSERRERNDTRYWTLEKNEGVTKATAYGMKNPVRNDYADLWFSLKEANSSRNSAVMPNLIRRIVETYFVGIGGYDKDTLYAGLYAKNHEDQIAIASLAKWFDEESHGVKDDIYKGNGEVMCKRYMKVFERLFEMMGQHGHYEMMMEERQSLSE